MTADSAPLTSDTAPRRTRWAHGDLIPLTPANSDITLNITHHPTPLPVPAAISDLVAELHTLRTRRPDLFTTFTDGPCLVFTAPPNYTVSHPDPDGPAGHDSHAKADGSAVLSGHLATSSYFTKSVARGTLPSPILDALTHGHTRAAHARTHIPHDHPLARPATGLVVLLHTADHRLVLTRRNHTTTVDPGDWAATAAEGLTPDDLTHINAADATEVRPNDVRPARLDLHAATRRALTEEVALTSDDLTHISAAGLMYSEGDICGYNFLTHAHTHLTSPQVLARHRDATDAHEASDIRALTIHDARTLLTTRPATDTAVAYLRLPPFTSRPHGTKDDQLKVLP